MWDNKRSRELQANKPEFNLGKEMGNTWNCGTAQITILEEFL